MTRIALFGTSADPPTTGHQQILSWLSEHFDQVVVWASDNPFKSHQTPLKHREQMLQLLVEEISSNCHNINLHPELSSPKTLTTVQQARTIWPDAELTVAVGSDLVSQLSQWYRIEALLQQVKLLVVPRPHYPVDGQSLEQLRQMGGDVRVADLTAPAVSSTAYRQQKDPESVTARVEAYIHQQHLYAYQDA